MDGSRMFTGRRARRLVSPVVAVLAMGAGSVALSGPAQAGTIVGTACAYYTNVSLFGGPYSVRGCGQDAGQPATAASPSVTLPAGGSNSLISATDNDGAKAQYGPAIIFGGQYDANDNVGPSGQLTANTTGTSMVQSWATASVVGPAPFHADFVRGYCTATTSGKTYTVQLTNAVVETSTDANGNPTSIVNVPSSPSAGYTVAYTINNVGDHGIIVFNERINNGDGSTTLNAVHMYMQGPIAYGEMVIGQARCGH